MVTEGCKQTEIGVIPEDWDVGNLQCFWSVTDCKHITAKFVDSGFPVASIKEVQSRFVDLGNAKQTTEEYYNHLIEGGRKPLTGDLILSRNATVGEIAQVADWHPLFAMGQDVCLLRKKFSDFSTSFLQSVISSSIVLKQLEDLMVGSTFRRVNVEQIKNLVVPMPQPEEQRSIATALSDVDALIESLDKLIAKKRAIKTATMQQLLTGKKRLPGFGEGKGYQKTAIGMIPEDWEISDLAENAKVIDSLHKTPDFCADGYPMVRVADIKPGNLDLQGTLKVRDAVFEEFTRNYQPKRSDIVLSRVGSYGISSFVETDEPFCLGQNTVVINSWIPPRFLYYTLNSEYIREQIEDESYGSGYKSLSLKNIKELIIAIPSTSAEQKEIATVLSDMDAEIAALEARRAKTQAIKQGMMQELLTGRIRLKIEE